MTRDVRIFLAAMSKISFLSLQSQLWINLSFFQSFLQSWDAPVVAELHVLELPGSLFQGFLQNWDAPVVAELHVLELPGSLTECPSMDGNCTFFGRRNGVCRLSL